MDRVFYICSIMITPIITKTILKDGSVLVCEDYGPDKSKPIQFGEKVVYNNQIYKFYLNGKPIDNTDYSRLLNQKE